MSRVVFKDQEMGEREGELGWKEEKMHLPLISSVIITSVISWRHEKRNKTTPVSLLLVFHLFFSVRVKTHEEEEEVERERG